MSYTLSDYHKIQTAFVLPQNVLEIIATIATKFGITSIPEPIIKQRNYRPRKQEEVTGWNREFKPTQVLEKGTKMNDIRVALNKLSTKNYDITSEFILEKIEKMTEDPDENVSILSSIIMDIISTNKMFSPLYAKLYVSLVTKFPDLFSISPITESYMTSISTIRSVDPTNYDDFCNNNKENDKRKTIATFITHLMNVGLLTPTQIFFMTNTLLTHVQEYMGCPDKTVEVDEITENVYILLTQQEKILNNLPEDIQEKVLELSKIKAKDQPSLSSRAIFKYIDMVERAI